MSAGRASITTCCVHFENFCNGAVGNSIILAEANVLPRTDMEYFGDDGGRMQMMFNFQVNQNLFYALASSNSLPLDRRCKNKKPAPDQPVGNFLRNHDELDLGRRPKSSGKRYLRFRTQARGSALR